MESLSHVSHIKPVAVRETLMQTPNNEVPNIDEQTLKDLIGQLLGGKLVFDQELSHFHNLSITPVSYGERVTFNTSFGRGTQADSWVEAWDHLVRDTLHIKEAFDNSEAKRNAVGEKIRRLLGLN